jgi:Holliday junction resolvase RusA-like endonuclease
MRLKKKDLSKIGLKIEGGVVIKKTIKIDKVIRVKESLGSFKFNNGTPTSVDSSKYVLDKSRRFYAFDVVPMGKPRMTQSDKWKTDPNHPDPLKRKREVVHRYHQLQNRVREQAEKMKFVLGKTFEAVFFVPLPNSWSDKKKSELVGMPCEEKPDIDNYTKFFLDTMAKEDKSVWNIKAEKRWAYYGSIIIFQ